MAKQYVGGVAEELRSEQERRFEELGLEEFFWSFIRLQSRVDDLEEQLSALTNAPTLSEVDALIEEGIGKGMRAAEEEAKGKLHG